MKKILSLFVIIIFFSCDKKVSFSRLKNENETYYYNDKPYTGEAFSDIETETPSTKYDFIEGTKQSQTDYFPETNKIKTEETYSIGLIQKSKEYSKDGMLLEKQEYVWNDSKDSVTVSIEWYDWCGKMKRRKQIECDKLFRVINTIYDQDIALPCN